MLGAGRQSDNLGFGPAQAVTLALLVGVCIVVTRSIWAWFYATGTQSEEQSHILIAPFFAAWLFWVRRDRLRFVRPGPSLMGVAIVAGAWVLAAFGFANGFDLLLHGGVLLMLVGAVVSVVGFDPVRLFIPAWLALLFVLPVPGRIRQAIALPLQEASARVTTWMLDLFAVPVERFGNVMTINGVDVAVAEACNGMRMVAALALVTFAFVFSTPMRNSVRIGLLLASPILALLVNIIRLAPTALWYGYGDHETADAFHDVAGWLMLVVALGMLWTILAMLRWIEVPIAPYAVGEE